jgi:hypothetical protein
MRFIDRKAPSRESHSMCRNHTASPAAAENGSLARSVVLLRLTQATFWAALVFTFVSAVVPAHHAIRLVPWDKAEHFIAFYVLTVLAAAAFPRRNLILIAIALSAFGAAIEVVQGLKFVSRDRDFWDWVADTTAIAAALAPMVLIAWRRRWRTGSRSA